MWLVALCLAGCQGDPASLPAESPREGTSMLPVPAADRVTEGDLDIRVEAMAGPRSEIAQTGRNPFSFGRSLPTPAAGPEFGEEGTLARPVSIEPQGSEDAVAGSSWRLRFIGLVDLGFMGSGEASTSTGQIAVLSDGDVVLHGRVGDTIDGRYRIIRIETDQVEVVRLADGDRRVLRLAGP